jgi:hypothetical protein
VAAVGNRLSLFSFFHPPSSSHKYPPPQGH